MEPRKQKHKGGAEKLREKKKRIPRGKCGPSQKNCDLFAQRLASTSGLARSSSSSRSELTKPPAPESSRFKNDDESSDTTEHGAAEPGQETTDVTMIENDPDVDRGDRPESSVTIMSEDDPAVRDSQDSQEVTMQQWIILPCPS
ncbi:Hypothetical predicted protein [Xyrichtys novacula]|uniref:Uncharacterized protein n=1 Tax=Xyrichtys novacula TaxID=13765 RepID=A0AAV1HLK9_XYRNO|nr:Hypothetical predicted protein [Xyrichtys novacula]